MYIYNRKEVVIMTIQAATSTVVSTLTGDKGKMEWEDYRALKSKTKEDPNAIASGLSSEQLDAVVNQLPAALLGAAEQAIASKSQCACGDLHIQSTVHEDTTSIAAVLSTPIRLFFVEWVRRAYSKEIADIALDWKALDSFAPGFLSVMGEYNLWHTEGEEIEDDVLAELIREISHELPEACALLRKTALEFSLVTPPLVDLMPSPPADNTIVLGERRRVSTQVNVMDEKTRQQLEIIVSSPLVYYITHFLQREEREVTYITMNTDGRLFMSVQVDPLTALGVPVALQTK